jgi:shikimate dehydrogenase
VAPENFDATVRALAASGYAGANVTVPHKLAALKIADEASPAATEIGAANTLSFTEERIDADNTDAAGLLAALPGSPSGGSALVLGAGGAARAVVWALGQSGASVSILNRSRGRAERLASELGATVAEPAPERGQLSMHDYDLVVNATSVGLHPMATPGGVLKALHLDADSLTERQIVVDLVYGAEETELLRAARARGAAAIDGREILVRQGAASFRIWTGLDPPVDVMRDAARSS